MSFFVREANGKLKFGGMKSIELNYEYLCSLSKVDLVDEAGDTIRLENLWIIGNAFSSNLVKGKLKATSTWTETRLAELTNSGDAMIMVRLNGVYHLYQNGSRVRYMLEDGEFNWYYGCTEGMVSTALGGVLPTRWLIESNDVGPTCSM